MADLTAPRSSVTFTLTGRQADATLPSALMGAARSGTGGDDVFLPAGYLQPVRTFDVGPAARGSAVGVVRQTHDAQPDEIIVLELADGGTLVTSATRLRETLRQTHPEMLDGDGTILLEKLRAEGAAPGRGLGDALGGLISKVFTLAVGAAPDAILDAALGQLTNKADLGVSWFGTQVLMRAIEDRLKQEPGLYRWVGATGKAADLVAAQLVDAKEDAPQADPARHAMLVFVHGTGSSTLASVRSWSRCSSCAFASSSRTR